MDWAPPVYDEAPHGGGYSGYGYGQRAPSDRRSRFEGRPGSFDGRSTVRAGPVPNYKGQREALYEYDPENDERKGDIGGGFDFDRKSIASSATMGRLSVSKRASGHAVSSDVDPYDSAHKVPPYPLTIPVEEARRRIKAIMKRNPKTRCTKESYDFLQFETARGLGHNEDIEFLFNESDSNIHVRCGARTEAADLRAIKQRVLGVWAAYAQELESDNFERVRRPDLLARPPPRPKPQPKRKPKRREEELWEAEYGRIDHRRPPSPRRRHAPPPSPPRRRPREDAYPPQYDDRYDSRYEYPQAPVYAAPPSPVYAPAPVYAPTAPVYAPTAPVYEAPVDYYGAYGQAYAQPSYPVYSAPYAQSAVTLAPSYSVPYY